jgi:competence protein ComEA
MDQPAHIVEKPAPPAPAPVPAPVPLAAAPAQPPAVLHVWPRSAQLTTAFLLGVAATLLTVHVLSSLRWASRPAELDRGAGLAYRIDLNRATRAELLQIPGIGPALAERIDDYRREHGFHSVEDLRKVKGIGPATFERIRGWVCVASDPLDDPALAPTVRRSAYTPDDQPTGMGRNEPSRGATKKEAVLATPIDINRASAEELQRLSGIGPALSQRIIDERAKRPFKSVDDLRRVSGIGPKTLERLRPSITVTPPAPENQLATEEVR